MRDGLVECITKIHLFESGREEVVNRLIKTTPYNISISISNSGSEKKTIYPKCKRVSEGGREEIGSKERQPTILRCKR